MSLLAGGASWAAVFTSLCGSRCGIPSLRHALHHRPHLLPVSAAAGLLQSHGALGPRGQRGVCPGEFTAEGRGGGLSHTHAHSLGGGEGVTSAACQPSAGASDGGGGSSGCGSTGGDQFTVSGQLCQVTKCRNTLMHVADLRTRHISAVFTLCSD